MVRFSILARLVMLAVVLLGALIGTNLYLRRGLDHSAEVLLEQGEAIALVKTTDSANVAFGDLKYWLADLAVSLLVRAEVKAEQARERLETELAILEAYAPAEVAKIRNEVEALVTQAGQAVDAYTNNQRVIGNALMAQARLHVEATDQLMAGLVASLQAEADQARSRELASAEWTARTAVAVMVLASILGILLTVVVIRSITHPLRRLVYATEAIASGNLEVPVPAAGRDEIGAMARTLALFRDGLAERRRLASERELAETELRRLQARLTDAIESISQGFALFDTADRLVISNSRYGEMLHPGDSARVVPGMAFEAIVRSSAEDGRIPAAVGRVDAWVAERIAQHRQPGAPVIQQREGDRWIQITERETHDGGIVAIYADITDLKRAEEALRASEEQMRAIVGNIPGVVWQCVREADDRIHYTFFSPRGEQILGLGRPTGAILANPDVLTDAMHPDDRARRLAAFEHSAAELAPLAFEFRVRTAWEEWNWFRSIGTPRRREDGKIAWDGISLNITELKRREDQLASANAATGAALAELQAVLDTIEYGIMFLDADLRVRITNRALRKLWQLPDSFVSEGQTLREMIEINRDDNLYDLEGQSWDDFIERRVAAVRAGDIAPGEMQPCRWHGVAISVQGIARRRSDDDLFRHHRIEGGRARPA